MLSSTVLREGDELYCDLYQDRGSGVEKEVYIPQPFHDLHQHQDYHWLTGWVDRNLASQTAFAITNI